jgi:hypothetical protein
MGQFGIFLSTYATVLSNSRGFVTFHRMKGETGERWKILCEQAANEQDPAKLIELVREINRLLDDKQDRLNKKAKEDGAV